MKPVLMGFLLFSLACGRVDLVSPSTPAESPTTATATATATGTGTATAAAPAAPAPAAAPAVVVNNNITNTQNGAVAQAPAAASAPSHPGLIAKGDTEAVVQAVLGTPSSLLPCNSDQTGWWYSPGSYCVGFENGLVTSQYLVPASKLYLPSW